MIGAFRSWGISWWNLALKIDVFWKQLTTEPQRRYSSCVWVENLPPFGTPATVNLSQGF